MTTEQIKKEWNRWMRAKSFGFPGDLVWSDHKGFKEYDQKVDRWMLINGDTK